MGSANVNQTSLYETAASVRMIITIFRTLMLMAVNVSEVPTCGNVIINHKHPLDVTKQERSDKENICVNCTGLI